MKLGLADDPGLGRCWVTSQLRDVKESAEGEREKRGGEAYPVALMIQALFFQGGGHPLLLENACSLPAVALLALAEKGHTHPRFEGYKAFFFLSSFLPSRSFV